MDVVVVHTGMLHVCHSAGIWSPKRVQLLLSFDVSHTQYYRTNPALLQTFMICNSNVDVESLSVLCTAFVSVNSELMM